MTQPRFPGWFGPILGPVVTCGIVYLKWDDQISEEWRVVTYAIAAVAGLIAGLVVWRLDALKRKEAESG